MSAGSPLSAPRFVPYRPPRLPEDEMRRRAAAFLALMETRRSEVAVWNPRQG